MLQAPDPDTIPHYFPAVGLFCLGALTELLAEPLWVLAHVHMFVRLKVTKSVLLFSYCILHTLHVELELLSHHLNVLI